MAEVERSVRQRVGVASVIRRGLAGAAVLCALAIGVAVVAVPASAMRAQGAYPPPAVSFQESASSVCPGQSVTVTGQGFGPASRVTITLMPGGVLLGTTTTNSAGGFSFVVRIPANTAPGQFTKVASSPTLTLTERLTVLNCVAAPAAPAPAKPPLALTGLQTRAWLAASLAFILLGTALVIMARKRRQHRAQ